MTQDTDTRLIELLRRDGHMPTLTDSTTWAFVNPDGPEAADRIESLRAEVARLREALERSAENLERLQVPHIVGNDVHNFAYQAAKLARTALGDHQ